MANLGDIGRNVARGVSPRRFATVTALTWPNVCRVAMPARVPVRFAGVAPVGAWPNAGGVTRSTVPRPFYGVFGFTRRTSGVVIDIPTDQLVTLLFRGVFVRASRGTGGHAYFYDLDDGSYFAVAQNGSSWSVVVSGVTATVTPIAAGETPAGLLVGDRLLVLADDGRIKTRPRVE